MPKVDTYMGADVTIVREDGVVRHVCDSTELISYARNWTLTQFAPLRFFATDYDRMRGGYKNNQNAARNLAWMWSDYISEHSVSYGELADIQSCLLTIGRQYGLLTEFRENGIC